MSREPDWSPEELDRLEDALEDLEQTRPPDARSDDAVERRMYEYRRLLQLSREALPMEDVPDGLLDSVRAHAHQVVQVRAPAASERSLWSRFWAPSFAFATSAALLLWFFVPRSDELTASTSPRIARSETEPVDSAEPAAPSVQWADASNPSPDDAVAEESIEADSTISRGQGVAAVSEFAAASAPPVRPKPTRPAGEAGLGEKKSPSARRARTGGRNQQAKAGLGDGATPVEASAPFDDVWAEILEGDRQRHRGQCGLATMRYEKARKADHSRVRARALAGSGLCKHMAGQFDKANKLFAQAKAADVTVADFIDSELRQDSGSQTPGHAPDAADASSANDVHAMEEGG